MNRPSFLRTYVAAAASAGSARAYAPNTLAGNPATAMLVRPYPPPWDAELRALLG